MGAVSGRPAARRWLRSLSPAVGAPCAAHWPLPQNHLFCFLWKHAAAEPCVGRRDAVPRSGVFRALARVFVARRAKSDKTGFPGKKKNWLCRFA